MFNKLINQHKNCECVCVLNKKQNTEKEIKRRKNGSCKR